VSLHSYDFQVALASEPDSMHSIDGFYSSSRTTTIRFACIHSGLKLLSLGIRLLIWL